MWKHFASLTVFEYETVSELFQLKPRSRVWDATRGFTQPPGRPYPLSRTFRLLETLYIPQSTLDQL